MLQIRLNRVSSSEGSGGPKSLPVETVTVACPDHLVLADLPVAKSIGTVSTVSLVKTVGRRSRRHLGERVHFCVRCDFPIAIYGRLSPCEHAFCLDCARSDSSCYLCDERIQKIQTIKMMEGIFICAAPHCLKSFLKRFEFESHIHESHSNLLQSKTEKEDGNELDTYNVARASSTDPHVKQSITADTSTARNQPRSSFSPSSSSQPHDLEEKAHRLQSREQPPAKSSIMQPKPPPLYGRHQNYTQDIQSDSSPAQLDRPGSYNRFHQQQSYDSQAGPHHWRDSDQFQDKLQGNPSESPFPDYPPVHSSHNPPNFVATSQGLAPPAFSHPPFPAEGAQPFQNAHYEVTRPDLASESGSEQGSLLGYPIPATGATNLPDNYPRPWNVGLGGGMPFDPMPGGQGIPEGYTNPSDSQGRVGFFQGDYGRGPGGLPLNPPLMPPMSGKGLEPLQGGNTSDHKDGKGVLAPQPLPLPLPPPPPIPHMPHIKRGNFLHSGDPGWEGQSYGWHNEKHDRFGGSKD